MLQKSIQRGASGTWETLRWIQSLGKAGGRNQYVILFVNRVQGVRFWDTTLRQYWQYEPEAEETLRTINKQVQNLIQYNKLIGDCDDAAVVAVAMAEAQRGLRYPHLEYHVVAVRRPMDADFSHVFVEVILGHQVWRIDPTAPLDADYTNWERMIL